MDMTLHILRVMVDSPCQGRLISLTTASSLLSGRHDWINYLLVHLPSTNARFHPGKLNIRKTPAYTFTSHGCQSRGRARDIAVCSTFNQSALSNALPRAGNQSSMHQRSSRFARSSPSFRALIILTNRISRPKASAAAAHLQQLHISQQHTSCKPTMAQH